MEVLQKRIVDKNLELLLNEGNKVLMRESFGGNGGYNNGNPCAGLNFEFDEDNGRITYFGNEPRTNGIFRVELNPNYGFQIINIFVKDYNGIIKYVKLNDSELNDFAKEVLIKTAEEYNRINRDHQISKRNLSIV